MNEIYSLKITPDEKYLLGSDYEGHVYVWQYSELIKNYLKSSYEGLGAFKYVCKFKLSDRQILQIILTNLEEKSILITLSTNNIKIFEWEKLYEEIEDRALMDIQTDKTLLFENKCLQALDAETLDLPEESREFKSIDFNQTTSRLYIANECFCCIFDLKKMSMVSVIDTRNDENIKNQGSKLKPNVISCVKACSNTEIATSSQSGIIQIWDANTNKKLRTFKERDNFIFSPINTIEIDKSGFWLLSGHEDYLTKWNISTGTLAYVLETEDETLCIKANYNQFVTGHNNSSFKVWDNEGNFLLEGKGSTQAIYCLEGSIDQKKSLMVTAGNGSFVDVFYDNFRIFSYMAY